MWLFTSNSFVSIVVDKENQHRLLIRARCKGDIEELFPQSSVFIDENADYRYRAYISKSEVSQNLFEYIDNLNYTNFKNSIPDEKSTYQDACLWVWTIMKDLQAVDPK